LLSIKIIGDKAKVNARLTSRSLAVVKLLEGRRSWLKGGGLQFEATGHNLKIIQQELGATIEGSDAAEFEPEPLALSTYTPKTPPMPHQERGEKHFNSGVKHRALFMEQGTGKTWSALNRAGQLFSAREITGLLVVSKRGVHVQWVSQQIPEHLSLPYTASAWPKPLAARAEGALDIFSINIDAYKTVNGRGQAQIKDFIDRHNGAVLMVIDESHQIMNKSTARWKASNEFGKKCKYRMILSGTPIAANLEQEWAQLLWLDQKIIGIKYISAFRREYCIMGGYENRSVIGSRNIERFKEITAPYVFRVTKEEIGIMPKLYTRWDFDLDPKQVNLIKAIKAEGKNIRAANPDGLETRAALGAVVRDIQQISNGFLYEDKARERPFRFILGDPLASPRLKALGDVLQIVEGPVIIWARYKQDIKDICLYLDSQDDEVEYVKYIGGMKDDARQESVQKFLSGECRVLISNPSAGGTGLNLQGQCRNAIYYSNSDNSRDRWQSEDRIHRIGTVGSIQYWDLISSCGVDKAIYRNLRGKKAFAGLVLDDKLFEDDDE